MAEIFRWRCECGAAIASPSMLARCRKCGAAQIFHLSRVLVRWKIQFKPKPPSAYILIDENNGEARRFRSPAEVRRYLELHHLPAEEVEMLLTELQITGEIECPAPDEVSGA